MRTYKQWMDDYGVGHQNPTNQLIHKVCVPLILFSVLGFLWCLPIPHALQSVPYLNWATVFTIYCLSIYLYLNFLMFIGMLIQFFLMLLICKWLYSAGILLPLSIGIFVVGWIGQVYGHKLEGKKPSFIDDMLFLLIGPLWVTRFIYKKFGINV